MSPSERKKRHSQPKSKRRNPSPRRLSQGLILVGVVILIVVVVALKSSAKPVASAGDGELPAAQLAAALKAGRPTLAFFHSNNCEQCLIMMGIVDQVFPEFSGTVALVDVNVYDPANEALLRQVRLQFIPTLIFYDKNGESETQVGVMPADQFRQRLLLLAKED